jgi:streptogrisin C
MAGWWGNSSQTVGKTVCRSGQTSGWRCGTIAATNINVNIGGTWVLHQWETSYSSALGDSGATMMDNGVAWMGVLSSITSTNSFYGTVDYAIQEPFGGSHLLNPCVSSGC